MEYITTYNDTMLLLPYFNGSFHDLRITNRSLRAGTDFINEVGGLLGGIWQGRFQMIHNGHYCVFKESLTKFSIKYIAIVNPNPQFRPCNYENFISEDDNRFNYFQRMLLWKMLIDDYNSMAEEKVTVNFFPCWHGQRCLDFENSQFLIANNQRAWIVPFLNNITRNDDQGQKVLMLRYAMRQNVYRHPIEIENDPVGDLELKQLHATHIREWLDANNLDKEHITDYYHAVPKCIADLQRKFYLNIKNRQDAFVGTPFKFLIVPFINNKIDLMSIQYALNMARTNSNIYIVFAISIKVKGDARDEWSENPTAELPWWFKPADTGNGRTYRERAELINNLMTVIGYTNYLTTPIFLKGNDLYSLYTYNDAFLPPTNNSEWILNDSIHYDLELQTYLQATGRIINAKNASDCLEEEKIVKFFTANESCREYLYPIVIDQGSFDAYSARLANIIKQLRTWQGTGIQDIAKKLDEALALQKRLSKWISNSEFESDEKSVDNIQEWIDGISAR